MPYCPDPATLSLICTLAATPYAGDDALELQLDRTFTASPKTQDESPIFISAQQIEGKDANRIEATGDVELRKRGQVVTADRMVYLRDSKEVSAEGSVRIEQNNDEIRGPQLRYNLDSSIGDMEQPEFYLNGNHARGNADSVHLAGKENYILHNVSYTTCPAGKDDWWLKTRELEIDRSTQIGVARHTHVEFKGVPILYSPWMDFPLGGQRKSGFLAPVLGSTVQGGNELTLPYYWNIAPNRDATIAPRAMLKRGLQLNNEFRYLEPSYAGKAHYDILPSDRVADRTRLRMALKHNQNLGYGLGGSLDLNKVSDDNYFRDLAGTVSSTSQTNLIREGSLTYNGGWWNSALRVQNFQTLQDPAAPVAVPYRRLPQFSMGAQRPVAKANLSLSSEMVSFHHPTSINGLRMVLYPSASYPLISDPAFYVTPKLGLHSTRYWLGANNTTALPDTTRTLPIFSLDSGVIFERNWSLLSQSFVHTLEPRVFYVHIPYKDQNHLPNFDSAQADFSFTQMFTENRFFGSDRIGDTNQVTLALTSRLLEQDNGAERFRVAVGQRFNTKTPRVNLVTPTGDVPNKSDILFAASGRVTAAWSLDSSLQYNPNQSYSEKYNLAVRYRPEGGKVLNLGYRFTRNSLRQAEISSQWPLSGRWNGTVRWNYSIMDRRTLESMTGLEYNDKCWTVRMLAHRFATATQQTSTGFFVQLELHDLVRVGSDALALMRQSIPGYTKTNISAPDKSDPGLR